MRSNMKKYYGLALTFVGVSLLAVSYPTGLSHFNTILLLGLLLVVIGIVVHVWMLKKAEKY